MPSNFISALQTAFEKKGAKYALPIEKRKEIARELVDDFCKRHAVQHTPRGVEELDFLSTLIFDRSAIRAGFQFGGLSLEDGPYHVSLAHQNNYLPVGSCLNGDLVCLDFRTAEQQVVLVHCATLGGGENSEQIDVMRLGSLKFLIDSIRTNNPFLPIDAATPWPSSRRLLATCYNAAGTMIL